MHLIVADHFMKSKYFLIFFTVSLLISACAEKSKKVIVTDVALETIEADESFIEPPPPPSLHFSETLTLKGCFLKFSSKEHPKSTDTAYNFVLYKINKHYVAFFIDAKSYKKNAQEWMIKKGTDYIDKYYPLSNDEFVDLSWGQVLTKIRSELKEFIKTEQFKNSSLGKAKSITLRFDDAVFFKIK